MSAEDISETVAKVELISIIWRRLPVAIWQTRFETSSHGKVKHAGCSDQGDGVTPFQSRSPRSRPTGGKSQYQLGQTRCRAGGLASILLRLGQLGQW